MARCLICPCQSSRGAATFYRQQGRCRAESGSHEIVLKPPPLTKVSRRRQCSTLENIPSTHNSRSSRYNHSCTRSEIRVRRVGRVAEGGGLLNRYRVKSSIGGSNPPLSAR